MPQWEEAHDIDIDYHLRHSALPHPGGERELGVLISRLHSIPMDMSKPLWECHLIEGLENRRFAVYQKAHHSAVDGFTAIKMMNNWLSDDPEEATDAGPWSLTRPARKTSAPSNVNANVLVKNALKISGKNLQGSVKLVRKMLEMARTADNPHGGLPNLLEIPRTIFNGRITKHRRVATQWIEMERTRGISKLSKATINDVCLAILGGALRPAALKDDIILKLQLFLQKDRTARETLLNALKVGHAVRVDSGPFASFEGVVTLLQGFDRVKVEVNIFGRVAPVALHLDQVSRIG